MSNEIERKYLLSAIDWREEAEPGVKIRQGYFTTGSGMSANLFKNSLSGENSVTLKIATDFGYDVIFLGLSEESTAELRKKSGGEHLPLQRGFEARTRVANGEATLTFKSGKGLSRTELEVSVEPERAEAWLAGDHIEGSIISKCRYRVPLHFHDQVAEVDVYDGANAGLEVVEVELQTIRDQVAPRPWIGPEITDGDLGNASLARRPWSVRSDDEKYVQPQLRSRCIAATFANSVYRTPLSNEFLLSDSSYRGFWQVRVKDASTDHSGQEQLMSAHGQLLTLPVVGPAEHARFESVLNEILLTGETVTSQQVIERSRAVHADQANLHIDGVGI